MLMHSRKGDQDREEAGASALSGLSDRDCVVLARSGSREARGELVERHLPVVYRLCLRLLRRREDAADAAQEAFVRAFGALQGFDPDRSFRAWLCAIAWNLVADEFRRARSRRARPGRHAGDVSGPIAFPAGGTPMGFDAVDGRQSSPLERLVRKERSAAIEEALGRLPPRLRALIVLRDVEGLSYEELSDLAGCRLGTTKSRVHRARMELKKALLSLRPDWFGEPSS